MLEVHRASPYVQRCWDELLRRRAGDGGVEEGAGGGGGGAGVHHDPTHTFEHIHPIESRHNTAVHGSGPWGNFGGSVSGRSRERLRDRTGL